MCGICGKYNYINHAPVEPRLINKMCAVLHHRGPDDTGIYINKNIGLGHSRLSIIDVAGGHQPIWNEDKTCAIILNGEIYNFKELRKTLKKKGHKFRTKSDTETILHLYEETGVDCLKQLRGMFAFAILDARDNSLFLARDRMGQKPLVYSVNKDGLLFASEIKSILQDTDITPQVDLTALNHYLAYQYVPAPYTMFKGIKKLPAAHYLILKDAKISIKCYWRLEFNYSKLSKSEYIEEFLRLFYEATKLRLISEVPLGAFLSGGIDSSAVVAAMSKFSDKPVKTFSIGFTEEKFN